MDMGGIEKKSPIGYLPWPAASTSEPQTVIKPECCRKGLTDIGSRLISGRHSSLQENRERGSR